MTTLMAERRRALFADDGQETLFGPEPGAKARPTAPWERRDLPVRRDPPRETARPSSGDAARPEARATPPALRAPVPAGAAAPATTPAERKTTLAPPEPDEIVAGDLRATPPVARALTAPTLDDVMTHAWEGLATGLPAACPVCHGEVVPKSGATLSGHCTSCGITID